MRQYQSLHQKNVRDKLPIRREPFWASPLAANCSFGFRKTPTGGTWIARHKGEDRKRKYKRLGRCTDAFGWKEAKAAAEKWFTDLDHGIVNDDTTIEGACRAFVEDRRTEKTPANAHDTERRFKSTVYGTDFGAIPLAKIRSARIKEWRNGLMKDNLSPTGIRAAKATSNRMLASLKAALNHAVEARMVSSSKQIEWASIKAYTDKDAGNPRGLFLDLDQRRALLANATGGIQDFLEAVALTGARAGELRHALLKQFDARTKSITLTGKTGTRTVPLSPAALKLFARLAKDKLPLAHLLLQDNGKPWGHSTWDHLVREAATKARLPRGVCMYTLRHSFISQAIMSGLSILDVAKYTGTSLRMIEKTYGHLVVDHVREKLALVMMA